MTPEQLDDLRILAAMGERPTADEAIDDSRLDELCRTVATLDQLHEIAPPGELRGRLLASVAGRPPRPAERTDVATLFANQVEALAELLDELTDSDWWQVAQPYAWTVHGLVAHLLVIERHTASLFGLSNDPTDTGHHLEIGADTIDDELAGPPAGTAARWADRARSTAAALCDHATELPPEVNLHGWPFSIDGAIIARAFEIWTHADDIRRATGRPLWSPSAGDLRTMSTFSVGSLPLTLGLVAPGAELTPTRLVLTGEGGASFDLGQGSAPTTTLVLDVVDYCRVAARRMDSVDLATEIDGDHQLARSLLEAAAVFAV